MKEEKSCANCGRYNPKKDCSELCFDEYEKWIPKIQKENTKMEAEKKTIEKLKELIRQERK